jgi:hypothetical protein
VPAIEEDSSGSEESFGIDVDPDLPSTSAPRKKRVCKNIKTSQPESTEKTLSTSESGNEEKTSESEEKDLCKICHLGETENKPEWIMCEGCDRWLHRNCAGLKHHLKWKKMLKKDSIFHCNDCK